MEKILWKNRRIIIELATNDLKAKFANSLLGVVWTFLHPLVNMLVIWLVFQVGFRSSNLQGNIPFIVWYMPAFLIWNYFSDATTQATNSFLEYSYLIKKVNFSIEIIPLIKIISAAIVHLFFICFITVVNMCYGHWPSLFYFQSLYYFLCAICLATSLGVFFGALAPFVPDINNIIAIAIQTGFWITPIFWDSSSLLPVAQSLLKLNPMYYVCQGYRDSFVYNIGFWHYPLQTAYFWMWVILFGVFGTRVLERAKCYFDDVL